MTYIVMWGGAVSCRVGETKLGVGVGVSLRIRTDVLVHSGETEGTTWPEFLGTLFLFCS